MYKCIHDKNYSWYIAIETFPKSAKKVSKAHTNGIHFIKSLSNVSSVFIVIHLFRIIIQYGKEVADNQ